MSALVAGGASGLGEASVRALHAEGMAVTIADSDADHAAALADALGAGAQAIVTDVTRDDDVAAAVQAVSLTEPLRAVIVCAGIAHGERLTKSGRPHARESWDRTMAVNLTGSFNVLRFAAAAMSANEPDHEGQRGVIVLTASVASYDGQVGQVAYAAAKAAIAGMTLPAARDLADSGIRVCAIAPGPFETPLFAGLPDKARAALAGHVPFPKRLGRPAEYGALVLHIIGNGMLNGEVIRLDGALRMPYL
jgi:NAD(P)-dependent dehydrogenase (short-subunit alcohol dehydrogenase family)